MLGSFDTVTSLHMGFCSERAAAGLGPCGLSVPVFCMLVAIMLIHKLATLGYCNKHSLCNNM